jgi:hypothetical protein
VRYMALVSLGVIGVDASNSVPAIARLLADPLLPDPSLFYLFNRARAATSLGNMGPVARNALPVLKANLGINRNAIRQLLDEQRYRLAMFSPK